MDLEFIHIRRNDLQRLIRVGQKHTVRERFILSTGQKEKELSKKARKWSQYIHKQRWDINYTDFRRQQNQKVRDN
jgi:uncharacterized protein YjaG (DUF416 family)